MEVPGVLTGAYPCGERGEPRTRQDPKLSLMEVRDEMRY